MSKMLGQPRLKLEGHMQEFQNYVLCFLGVESIELLIVAKLHHLFSGVSWESGNNLFLALHPDVQSEDCKLADLAAVGLQECKKLCLTHANCTVVNYLHASETPCQNWHCTLPVGTSAVVAEDPTISSFWLNTGDFR